jgi:uncharacterized protein
MSHLRSILITLALSFVVLSIPASAQDFERGYRAFERGDYAAALRDFRPLADRGIAKAQLAMGLSYLFGEGKLNNGTKAIFWIRKAAEQDFVPAQNMLGRLYANGQGVPEDRTAAHHWYLRASEQGDAQSQTQLGVQYLEGIGIPKDIGRAYMWFNLAAAQGNADGRKAKDMLVEIMDPEDITEAQRLSRECLERDYKGC